MREPSCDSVRSRIRNALVVLALVVSLPCLAQVGAGVATHIAGLSDTDWQLRRDSAEALGALRTADKKAIAALTVALGDDDSRVRRAAAEALGQIGPPASKSIPQLIGMLDDIDPRAVEASARAVGLMGRRASRTVSDLTGLLDHADAGVRAAASAALGAIGDRAGRSASELAEQIRDPDPAVRAAAAHSLGQMGPRAARFSSQLVQLLDDRDSQVRQAASVALGRIGKGSIDALIRALQRGDPVFLQNAVEALGRIGAIAARPLIATLEDESNPVLARRYAAMALAEVGAGDKRVVPALAKALGNEMPEVRMSAAAALGNIGPAAAAALPELISLSGNQREDVLVREYSIAALARIAPADGSVNSALVRAVADDDPRVYEAALAALVATRALAQAHGGMDERIAALTRQLQNGTPEARLDAARRLGEFGPYAAPAVPVLTAVLAGRQNDAELRQTAAMSLGLIGPRSEGAVPELIAVLDDENRQIANSALVALGRIGPQTRNIPALLQAMRSGDLATRGAAAASLQQFASTRMNSWQPLLQQSDAPVLRNWLARHSALYGVDEGGPDNAPRAAARRRVDYFDVLGGGAAMRESIQLDLIAAPLSGDSSRQTIPLSSIRSVNVRSHPFDKMLADSDRRPGQLALAEFAPADHFFVYFSGLAALREVFASGAEQFLRFESAMTAKSVEYDLEQQYMNRLGLSAGALDRLEALHAIGGLALIAPDLFFVDGIDVTVIAELASPQVTQAALQLIGLGGAGEAEYATYTLPNGGDVYWALRGDVLAISTSRDELLTVLGLHARHGRGSLGQSDEFLYMLLQMGVEPSTRAFLYFSDPFIRQLVSPAVKIGQLRRMQARAEMEMLAAGALLYLLDGHSSVPNKQRLIDSGYVPRYFEDRDYTISEELIVASAQYGTIAELKPLSANPAGNASLRESEAYADFVDDYSRYWGQFFDPIATRLDRIDDNTYEINTFILPLPDSRLYSQVQQALATREGGHYLKVPVMRPTPSMVFSVNVSDRTRVELSQKLASLLMQYTSVDPGIFDSIDSGVHLAVQDATPIVALGSGDVWGALDRDMLRMQGFESFLPFLLSLVTQPSTVLIELAEPARVRDFLNDAVVRRSKAAGEGEFHRLQGKEAWIYSLNVMDMFQLHLRVEIKEGYLLISNLPWSTQLDIDGVRRTDLNGAELQLNLDQITQQLPALHTKVYSDYRSAAIDGMGYLYPLLVTGVADTVPEAVAKHFEVFGFKPLHPSTGEWLWRDSYLESTEFGSALRPVQPEFRPGESQFGLFPSIERLGVNIQLEGTGLRARIRWQSAGD